MGGYGIGLGGQDSGYGAPDMDPMARRRGLFAALLGAQQAPTPLTDSGAGGHERTIGAEMPNRIQDDRLSRNSAWGDGQAATPVGTMAGSRGDDTHLRELQGQYEDVGRQIAQPPQRLSLLRRIIGGALAGPATAGVLAQRQRGEEFQQNQLRERQNTLLQNIEAERRMQEQEGLATDRMTLQERMQGEREHEAQEAQGRLFAQQNELEGRRESARQEQMAQAEAARRQDEQARQDAAERRQSAQFAESERRQSAQFGEQEKLLTMREQQRQANQKPTADETRRYDLANNMNENLNELETIAKTHPELFGPVHGRITRMRQFFGTSDPNVARLEAIREYLGMASVGAHAMRNAQHVGTAADAVMAGMHNSAGAVLAAIDEARKSTKTFQDDIERERGGSFQRQPGAETQPQAKPKGAPLKERVSGRVLVEGQDF